MGAVCIAACACLAQAQTDSLQFTSVVRRDVETAFHDAVRVVSAPGRWRSGDWAWVGAALAATGGGAIADDELRALMQRNSTSAADRWANTAVVYGDGWFAAGVTAGLYGTGFVIRNQWLRETAVLVGTAVIVSSLVTRIIKPVAGRARPYVGDGNATFHMMTLQDDHNSFPSGHTVAAFSISSVLAARIDNPLATVGLYGMACLTALSRVYTDQHWFSDIVFGGIFASAIGRSLVAGHESGGDSPQSFHIVPAPDRVTLVYSF